MNTAWGGECSRLGEFSRAMAFMERAWHLSKGARHGEARNIAFRAMGELAEYYSRFGRTEQLETLLEETHGFELMGPVTEKISSARAGLALMKTAPEQAFMCGPFGLAAIARTQGKPSTDLMDN